MIALSAFIASVVACKMATKMFSIESSSSTLSVNLEGVQAFAAVRVVYDDAVDRDQLRVDVEGPDDVQFDVAAGSFSSEVKITAKSASFVGTTSGASAATTNNGGGTTSGGGATSGNSTSTGATTGATTSSGSRLQHTVQCGVVGAAALLASDSNVAALASFAACATSSFAAAADECYLKVTITLATRNADARFTGAAASVAVSCAFTPSAQFLEKAVDVKDKLENRSWPLTEDLTCVVGSSYVLSKTFGTACPVTPPSTVDVTVSALGTVRINNKITSNSRPEFGAPLRLTHPDLAGKSIDVWEGDNSARTITVSIDTCSYIYSCVSGVCVSNYYYNAEFCGAYEVTSEIPAAPPAVKLNNSCAEFAMSGLGSQDALWRECLQKCHCPRDVDVCCGQNNSPVITCNSDRFRTPCFKSFGSDCKQVKCTQTCTTGSNCTACTASNCNRQCSCSPDASYRAGCSAIVAGAPRLTFSLRHAYPFLALIGLFQYY